MKWYAVLLLFLIIYDSAATVYVVHNGFVEEGNPIMLYMFLEFGMIEVLIIKIVLVFIFLYIVKVSLKYLIGPILLYFIVCAIHTHYLSYTLFNW
jgi:hypothetical protein